MSAILLDLNPLLTLDDDRFEALRRANPELKLEQTPTGEIIVMSLTGGETGIRNSELVAELVLWNRQTRLGKVFDSSTGFRLPIGSKRSPDVAWVAIDRWEALSGSDRAKFPPIAPDFVIELLSPSDELSEIQAKMREYALSGVRLGWLLIPQTRSAEIYRLNQPPEILPERPVQPLTLDGEDVLPGFSLDCSLLWDE